MNPIFNDWIHFCMHKKNNIKVNVISLNRVLNMILLNKKRIMIIFTSVILSIFVYFIGQNSNKLNTIQTVSLPITNKTVILDAGHGRRR